MILQRECSVFSKTGLLQAAGTALLYGILIIPYDFFMMTEVAYELRLATFVPVVAGLIFGLPAAIGAFIGNFCTVFLTDSALMPALVSSILNFLLAYGPYRIWYGYQSHNATLYVYNNRTFLKFILIDFYGAFNLSVLYAFFMQGYAINGTLTFVFITFINNFAFPLLLGIPLLFLWNKYSEAKYYRAYENPGRWRSYCIFAIPLLIILNIIGLYLLGTGQMSPSMGTLFTCLGVLLSYFSLQIPSEYHTYPDELNGFRSLVSEVSNRLFICVDLLVLFFWLLSISKANTNILFWYNDHDWLELYTIIAICLTFFISGIYLVLLVMERSLTQRLKLLCNRVKNYHATHNLTELQPTNMTSVCKNELDIMEYSLNKMGIDIDHYLADLDNTIAEKKLISTQLNVAASIQYGILPQLEQIRPKLKGYEIKAGMTTAKSIGGDNYDAFLIDGNHLIISIADTAGKGIPAALFMMTAAALLNENAKILPMVKAVEQTNNVLAKHNEQCLFVTVWIACLELSTGHISYINAGHNPPLLAEAGAEKVKRLEELSGPVLGLMPDVTFTIHEAELPSGSRLLLYTDGLNEAENTAHEFFGNERLEKSFLASSAPEQILADIHDFVLDAEQSDDMTYLWLERKEVPHNATEN